MKQANLARLYLLLFGGIFFITSCVNLVRFYRTPNDIWWTPITAPMSLEQSRDKVEVYIRGVPLQNALQSGRVQFAGQSGSSPVTTAEIGIRLNNRDRIKAERVPLMIASAAGAGFTGLLFLLGLIGWLPSRRSIERVS